MNNKRSHKSLSLAALLCAVRECRIKPLGDPQRIVVLLSPPGLGLPSINFQALQRRGVVLLKGTPLDKVHLRFLKRLAHHTRLVPLLLASAEQWRQWNRRRPIEFAQIRRRTHLLVQLDK